MGTVLSVPLKTKDNIALLWCSSRDRTLAVEIWQDLLPLCSHDVTPPCHDVTHRVKVTSATSRLKLHVTLRAASLTPDWSSCFSVPGSVPGEITQGELTPDHRSKKQDG